MASITSPTKLHPHAQSHLLEIPDEEVQRGRKRRRSSGDHTSTTGSTTLRGRGRRRSLSASIQSSGVLEERTRSRSPGRKSPGKKYAKKYLEVASRVDKKRRSQSPSRSRSLGQQGERKSTPKPRRRQRTRSRSRIHGEKKSEEGKNELGSASVDPTEVAVED